MKITVEKRERTVVDCIATIGGYEFDLYDLYNLLTALRDSHIRVREPSARELKKLGILASSGTKYTGATAGPNYEEALAAVVEAIAEAEK